jgi:hypothetical protein
MDREQLRWIVLGGAAIWLFIGWLKGFVWAYWFAGIIFLIWAGFEVWDALGDQKRDDMNEVHPTGPYHTKPRTHRR